MGSEGAGLSVAGGEDYGEGQVVVPYVRPQVDMMKTLDCDDSEKAAGLIEKAQLNSNSCAIIWSCKH